jgi:adenylate kinase family enzyme
MERDNIKKFIIILYGPQCSGKSTVAKLILEKVSEVFHASVDKIKWLISDYSAEKYSGKGITDRLVLALMTQAAKEGFSILVEGNTKMMANTEIYSKMAADNNLQLVEVNIEAPYDILLDRFNLRVKDSEIKGNKISVKTEEGMKERFDKYQELKNHNIPTFDSAKMSPEEILLEIEKLYN